MKRLIAVAVAATAALTLVACGDDAKSSPTIASTPVVDETVVDETVVDETVAGDGSAFCDYQAEINEIESPFDLAAPTPADFEDFYTNVVPGVTEQLQALAPEELKADVAKVSEGIVTIGVVLAANEWDVTALENDPDMQAMILDPAFQTASENIDNYCGF